MEGGFYAYIYAQEGIFSKGDWNANRSWLLNKQPKPINDDYGCYPNVTRNSLESMMPLHKEGRNRKQRHTETIAEREKQGVDRLEELLNHIETVLQKT